MIDPRTSLAFSVYSGKGVYAALLGSGLSRAAEIPTGWDVTLDLIRRVAAIEKAKCGTDPAGWFTKKYGKEPDYSLLLEKLALTPAERTNALSAYFEATAEDREQGKKTPTEAHKAIAQLVAKGYIRVIITTNFDRLMEQALEEEGVNPTVISTGDMALGALPLVHSQCTVVKIHGDYRDTRLRNTSEELSKYSAEMDKLLDRVFDEYGLIVCGWSAKWDEALRNAILRCPNRRFSTIWATRSELADEAKSIVQFRHGSVVKIESADEFFSDLAEKVHSLESFNRPHPLSTSIAVASLKRFLVEDKFHIELRELLTNETERQFAVLSGLAMSVPQLSCERFIERMKLYETSMEMLSGLLANGCFYGKPNQASLFASVIQRMIDLVSQQGGSARLLELRTYPACILLYAGGIAAVAASQYKMLKVLLCDIKMRTPTVYSQPGQMAIKSIYAGRVLLQDILQQCLSRNRLTPGSDLVHELLRDTLRPLLPSDDDYDDAFDRFEFLLALVYYDAEYKDSVPNWAPVGRFFWRGAYAGGGKDMFHVVEKEFLEEGKQWGPIQSGMFSSAERFKAILDGYREKLLPKWGSFSYF